ncbi:DUF5684 domain-containing protein [Pseudodesulfovibrio sediminis]|uniref:Signal peptidase I n=1 Tax=Pseudodesulfovibrio sediminis TaxID=2810563 RepID=A0ABN6EX04_9BACT|nr:DUF5684 domain-containing protein [Pseudodesulfovibrio sediminis]BCS89676.1 hypothetical protein PSDVSF_29180 [Pseudodesulfovibrio sediminis]
MSLISLIIIIAVFAGLWKTYAKAGEPGWACLIPVYNLWVLVRIAGREWYWFVLFLIPLINIIVFIIISLDITKRFKQPMPFAAGLFLLPWIFYPILGFGSAQYQR